jgi:hypothetical protein
MAMASHQQNGQHCGSANGTHGAQKPAPVGTVVRSTCQTWFGSLAVTTRSLDAAASARRSATHPAREAADVVLGDPFPERNPESQGGFFVPLNLHGNLF